MVKIGVKVRSQGCCQGRGQGQGHDRWSQGCGLRSWGQGQGHDWWSQGWGSRSVVKVRV